MKDLLFIVVMSILCLCPYLASQSLAGQETPYDSSSLFIEDDYRNLRGILESGVGVNTQDIETGDTVFHRVLRNELGQLESRQNQNNREFSNLIIDLWRSPSNNALRNDLYTMLVNHDRYQKRMKREKEDFIFFLLDNYSSLNVCISNNRGETALDLAQESSDLGEYLTMKIEQRVPDASCDGTAQ